MTDPLPRALLLVCLCSMWAAAAADDAELAPSPELTPDAVVRTQLEALRGNDAEDRGIEIAFRFASPGNKASTGPLPRFARMIKEGPYALMLRYDSADFEPVEIRGDLARQRVTLVAPGVVTTYAWILSRQAEGPCSGCWMTDAVLLQAPKGDSI